ncbi:MAG: hypothetical protein HY832_02350 [Candidatus Aenigmarchaeota archaeon]|nr:hypothetical protein [Candidatus Aenigmarchaeota archaeon]
MVIAKVVLAVVIVLAIVLYFLGSHPVVSDFFNRIAVRLGHDTVQRPVNVTLDVPTYNNLSLVLSQTNISVSGNSSGFVGTNAINTARPIVISGFQGAFLLDQGILTLNGTASSVAFVDVTITESKKFYLHTAVDDATINLISSRDIQLTADGLLTTQNISTAFHGSVLLTAFKGSMHVAQNLTLEGNAQKIRIPSASLVVG